MKRLVQLIGERHGLTKEDDSQEESSESGLTNEAPDKQTDAQSLQSEDLDDDISQSDEESSDDIELRRMILIALGMQKRSVRYIVERINTVIGFGKGITTDHNSVQDQLMILSDDDEVECDALTEEDIVWSRDHDAVEKEITIILRENPAPTLRTIVTDIDKDTSVDLDKAEERWMPIFEILSSMKEREIVKVNAGPHQHALDQSWVYIVVNQVLYNAIIQVLRSNGSLTVVQIDDAIYPITVMKSQRLDIERCIDHLMDKAILRRTLTYEEDKGDVYYYHLTNRGIVETHEHDESSISDESVDEVTGY